MSTGIMSINCPACGDTLTIKAEAHLVTDMKITSPAERTALSITTDARDAVRLHVAEAHKDDGIEAD